MDQKQRDEILARVDAATPGPWRSAEKHGRDTIWLDVETADANEIELVNLDTHYIGHGGDQGHKQGQADMKFIAHARTDVPALLDALTTSESDLAAARAEITDKDKRITRLREGFTTVLKLWRESLASQDQEQFDLKLSSLMDRVLKRASTDREQNTARGAIDSAPSQGEGTRRMQGVARCWHVDCNHSVPHDEIKGDVYYQNLCAYHGCVAEEPAAMPSKEHVGGTYGE